MKLLTLHVDLLLCLFNNHFSLHEQFYLRSICRQVCHLLESSHCIGRTGSLKLFWSFRDIERYTSDLFYTGLEEIPELRFRDIGFVDDDLVLNGATFCAATCELFVRLFPKVRHLVIYFTFTESYPDYILLTRLLNQWQDSLVGLSLFGVFRHRSIAPNATQEQNSWARVTFGEAINQLGALKYFDLYLENLFNNIYGIRKKLESTIRIEWLPAHLANIVPNLERLFFCGGSEDFEQNVLRHLGPACTWLSLAQHRLGKNELRTSLNTTAEHAQMSFTTIILFDELELLSEHFCCETVQSVSLHQNFHSPLQLTQVLDKLAQLKRLHKLNLGLFDLNSLIDNSSSSFVRLGVSTLPRISNLTILLASTSDPVAIFATILPYVFPGVLCFTLHIPVMVMGRDFVRSALPPPLTPSNVVSFRHCTKFRLFLTESHNYEGTYTGLLSRQHRERFQREKIDGHWYDTMQQWKRSTGSNGQWVEI